VTDKRGDTPEPYEREHYNRRPTLYILRFVVYICLIYPSITMTVTYGVTGTNTDGGGSVNNGRRVLMAKTDSLSNVNNNNNSTSVNNNNGSASITGKASVLSVRRVLFGPPADPAETRAWLDRQLCAATAADSRSWNFDFVNERPLRDSPADRYAWERVCPPKRREEPAAADSTTTATALQQQQHQDCNRTAVKRQRQSKVTGNNDKLW